MHHSLPYVPAGHARRRHASGIGRQRSHRKIMRTLRRPMFSGTAFLLTLFAVCALQAQQNEEITIDARASTSPFPHFWEEMFGSGRAALVLRTAYQNDLTAVKAITDM